MVSYFIGNTAGNGDPDAGDGILTIVAQQPGSVLHSLLSAAGKVLTVTAVLIHYIDGGSLGSAFPLNPKIKHDVILTGELQLNVTLINAAASNVVTGTAVVSGSFVVNAKITDPVVLGTPALSGILGLVIYLRDPIVLAASVQGELVFETYGTLTREFFALALDERPTVPWFVNRPDVIHYSQILTAPSGGSFVRPLNEPFLVDPSFLPENDTILAALGARANFIGMVIEREVNGVPTQQVRFRPGEPNEIVIDPATCELLRWDEEQSRWVQYRTQPQRNLDGQLAFQLFDPEGIYDYFAKMLGLCMVEWQYDTAHLASFIDPLLCPDEYVPLLANNFGLEVDDDVDLTRKRELIRQHVVIQKEKGTAQSFRDALRALGYVGYATNIWVIPGDTTGTQYVERPIGWYDPSPTVYFPTSQVAIHLNELDGDAIIIDGAIKQEVAAFLVENVLPAHVRIRTFITDLPTDETNSAEAVQVTDAIILSNV